MAENGKIRHGLVVKADGSRPRGCGFKPWHRILYGCKRFARKIEEKLKIKVAKWGTPKKRTEGIAINWNIANID